MLPGGGAFHAKSFSSLFIERFLCVITCYFHAKSLHGFVILTSMVKFLKEKKNLFTVIFSPLQSFIGF